VVEEKPSGMEVYVIPFQNESIIYLPLRRLAFLGNRSMVRYVQALSTGSAPLHNEKVDAFLNGIGFWKPPVAPSPPSTTGIDHRPTLGVLLMTNACNMACVYCYAHGGEGALREMSEPLAFRVIDTVCDNAVQRGQQSFALAFHGGGEPTMNWKVFTRAVQYARDKDLTCEISLSTNGVWPRVRRDFILQHCDSLCISFDGLRRVQDAQRPSREGRSSFESVLQTFEALDDSGRSYGVRMTVTDAFVQDLAEGVEFICETTNCPIVQVEPCYTAGRGTHADPTPDQANTFVKAFLEAYDIATSKGRTLIYSGARPAVIAPSFCRALEQSLVVTPEGDVVACFETCARTHPLIDQFVIGRASSSGISVDAEAVRAFARRRAEKRSACAECFCFWHCGGDCATRTLGIREGVRERCRVNRAITRELLIRHIHDGGGVWVGASE